MAKSSNRVGLFSSQRGRSVKKWLWVAGALALGGIFANGIISPTPDDSVAEEQQELSFTSDQVTEDPDVAAPIARPFGTPLVGGEEEAGSGDIFGTDVGGPNSGTDEDPPSDDDDDGDDDEETATDRLQRGETYQSAVTLTQQFAEAYGTYSTEESAEEWVESLPGLDTSARESLLASAEARWPEMEDREVSSEAAVAAQSVTPIYSRNGGEDIQLSVTVTKETMYEGDEGFAAESYAVTLERDSSSPDGWIIVAVV